MTRAFALLIAATCTVCCGAKGGPVVTPGQVVVDGDKTFRTREGNVIEVSIARQHAGHDATGTATLRGITLDEAKRSPLTAVAAGRAWQTIYRALTSEPNAAYEAAQRGLDELGTHYRSANRDGRRIIDDTGHTVRLAQSAAEQGDFASAAERLGSVLATRLELYGRAFAGSVE